MGEKLEKKRQVHRGEDDRAFTIPEDGQSIIENHPCNSKKGDAP